VCTIYYNHRANDQNPFEIFQGYEDLLNESLRGPNLTHVKKLKIQANPRKLVITKKYIIPKDKQI
jgi:hypothetical protein